MNRFGPDRIRVVPYEWLQTDPDRFLKGITEFVSPGFDQPIPNIQLNVLPQSAMEVEYRRAQYKIKHATGSQVRMAMLNAVKGIFPVLKTWYRLRYGMNPQRSSVPDDVVQRLRPQLIQSNRRVEALTGLALGELGYDI
jgi:hypothetical protein